MSIVAKDTAKDFIPAPEGLHSAVCVDVVDKGMVDNSYDSSKPKVHKCDIRWQIEERMESGKPYIINARYTVSLHKKANLRRDLEAWRGRKFTPEQLKGFKLDNLIGKNCQLQVIHNTPEDTTYANVQSIVPLGKGMKGLVPEDYIRMKDKDNNDEKPQTKAEPEPADDDDLPF